MNARRFVAAVALLAVVAGCAAIADGLRAALERARQICEACEGNLACQAVQDAFDIGGQAMLACAAVSALEPLVASRAARRTTSVELIGPTDPDAMGSAAQRLWIIDGPEVRKARSALTSALRDAAGALTVCDMLAAAKADRATREEIRKGEITMEAAELVKEWRFNGVPLDHPGMVLPDLMSICDDSPEWPARQISTGWEISTLVEP